MSLSNNFPTTPPSLNLDFANVKALDPRVTFTRSTTATYYDGVTVAMAEQNLFPQSQSFENATWFKSGLSVTANTVAAPDGTTTADTLTEDAANSPHVIGIAQTNFVASSGTMTFSYYAKANTRTACTIKAVGGATEYVVAIANLSAGTISAVTYSGTRFSGASASITSAGNSWYRISLTFTVTTIVGGDVSIGLSDSTTPTILNYGDVSYTGNGTSGIYIWGAQLEQRSTATAYTATTTQPITNYIPVLQTAASGIPRFDHNPTTSESLGLLIEEQRTNIASSSEAFQNWASADFTVTSNTIVGPGGTLTGDKPIANSTNTYHYISQTIATVASSVYSCSVYLKQGENRYANILVNNSGGFSAIGVDMQAGTIVTNSVGVSQAASTIQSVGNGWYRATLIVTAASTTVEFRITASNSSNTNWIFAGDGFSGFYVWGAQAELGAFPTSYIATTTAAATRNADDAGMTGTNFSSWYDAGEGSLFTEADIIGTPSLSITVELGDASYTNRMALFGDLYNGAYFIVDTNGVRQATINAGSYSFNTVFRLSSSYKVNDFAASINNATAATDTSGTIPVITTAYLGYQGGGGGYLNGHLRRVAYYPVRLTNAQLQAITS